MANSGVGKTNTSRKHSRVCHGLACSSTPFQASREIRTFLRSLVPQECRSSKTHCPLNQTTVPPGKARYLDRTYTFPSPATRIHLSLAGSMYPTAVVCHASTTPLASSQTTGLTAYLRNPYFRCIARILMARSTTYMNNPSSLCNSSRDSLHIASPNLPSR